jgi:acyl carrier protein
MNAEQSAEIKQVLRNFILDSVNFKNLADDDDLFESGIVNSLFAVQWMTFIEKTFHIEIGVDDLDIQNFKSLNAATAFVLKHKGDADSPTNSK